MGNLPNREHLTQQYKQTDWFVHRFCNTNSIYDKMIKLIECCLVSIKRRTVFMLYQFR